jgi:hypothetical protein
MLRLGIPVSRSVRDGLALAERHFTGLGLRVESSKIDTIRMAGGGGFVEVKATPNSDDKGCELDVSTSQWESQVREFARRYGGR